MVSIPLGAQPEPEQASCRPGNPAWVQGAGQWCRSAADFVRILATFDPSPHPNVNRFLSPEQVLFYRDELRHPNGATGLFGYFGAPEPGLVNQLWMTGGFAGCASYVNFFFNDTGPNPTGSVCTAIFVDIDSPPQIDGNDFNAINGFVMAMEAAKPWPTDYFDVFPPP
jgi:hypothetical protein